MNKKPPMLLIAGLLGVLAIGGTALLLSRGPGAVAPAAAPLAGTPVALAAPTPAPQMRYIANRDIPPRTVLTSDMLRRTEISGPMPAGAITSLDDVRGKITSKTIRSGDTISGDSFTAQLDRAILANFTVPSGFRAVAVYVNPAQTAAGLVDVGDRVDVIATTKLSIDKQPNQMIVGAKEFTTGRTIGTNLLVLAVERSLNAPPPQPAATPEGAPNPSGTPDAAAPAQPNAAPTPAPEAPTGNIRVVLAAPLETSSRLVAANESGNLHVIIRNPLDGDSEAAPETREYPSRAVTVAQPKANNGGGGGGGGNSGGGNGGNSSRGPAFPVPDLPPVTVSQSTETAPPMPMPVGVAAPVSSAGGMQMGGATEPSGANTRDVMVVRGTEKTRVIVPKR